MAGINQGVPETAIGEPIRLGDSNEFEIEQHPVSDRLIIRDTVNGKVAYVRKERGGQIGGDGVLVKALKEGKPVADDGRTHDTIQEAERAASSFVFVPPGTYNENVTITTEGLTLRGSGYNTFIDGGSTSEPITGNADNLTIKDIRIASDSGSGQNGIEMRSENSIVENLTLSTCGNNALETKNSVNVAFTNCTIENCDSFAHSGISPEGIVIIGCNINGAEDILAGGPQQIFANNVIRNSTIQGIEMNSSDGIVIGNRIINASNDGIAITGDNNIVANNRVSDSGVSDIDDTGTGTLLDANLTGASN